MVALVLVRRFDRNLRHPLELPPYGDSTAKQLDRLARHLRFHEPAQGGANFAMCEGSTHFISEQIDFQLYRALATIDGTETVTADGTPVDIPP